MARKKSTSKFAQLLTELGFVQISSAPVVRLVPGNRAARRRAAKTRLTPVEPYFTASDLATLVKDETGCTWSKLGRVDMSVHGFANNSGTLEAFWKARRETDPSLS